MSVPALTVFQNGQNQVSGDQLNTFTQTAMTVANLRTFVGILGMEVNLQGFTAPNDGGQGQFYWNSTSMATDDSGITTVVPSGATVGAWIRLGSGSTSTLVNTVTNSDGSITTSPTSGNVVVSLGNYGANTVLANATAGSAQPTGVALTASTLLGRIAGNIVAVPFSTFVLSGGTLNVFNSITGCLPSVMTGSSTTASMTVSSGLATDATNSSIITSAGYIWSVGNGNAINGYSGGTTLASSTTIHMYLCTGVSGTGTYAIPNASFPLAAANAPTGYTSFVRRIFSFNTGATTAGPIPYTAVETEGGSIIAWLSTQLLDITTSSQGATRIAYALTVPAGIKVSPIGRFSGNTTGNYILTSGDETDVAPASGSLVFTAAPGFTDSNNGSSGAGGTNGEILTTNTSAQIGVRGSTSSLTCNWVTRGFKDFRRN